MQPIAHFEEKMQIARRVLIFVALWLLFEGAISLFATCESPYQPSDPTGGKQAKEYCSALTGPVLASGWAFLYWLGHVLEGYGEAVIAVFTIVLAFATGLLWKATRDLVRGSEKTAERQLRAYVIIGESDIRLVEKHTLQTFIHLHNFGQTPAYDVQNWVDMRIGKPDSPPFAQRLPFQQSTLIGPGGDYIIAPDRISISLEVPDQIRTGTKVIFIWGEVLYRDAFGKRWIYRFFKRNSDVMMRITDTAGITSPGWGLSPYPGLGYQEHEAEYKG